MAFPNPDFSKRDYLLPAGCKDLSDAMKQEHEKALSSDLPDPPITRTVSLPDKVSVKFLAEITGAGLYIISMQVSVGVNRSVTFEEAAKILRKYGIAAERANPPEQI